MIKRLKHLISLGVLALLFWSGCVKEFSSQPLTNKQPKTFLWLQPDSALSPVVSKQQLHWWGEDADGIVIGYLFASQPGSLVLPTPDTLTYKWISKTDTLMQFALLTSKENFLVVVRAVDNTFKSIPDGEVIRFIPRPYWDKNRNGVLDAGDVEFPSLPSAIDPVGARQAFPIKNTPPSVRFLTDPLDPNITLQQPETTYTVASFSWIGSDPDGDETLAGYRIALNGTDSTRWFNLSSNISLVTLMVPRSRSDNATGDIAADVYSGTFPSMRLLGSINGLRLNNRNVLYLQVRDVAGDLSPSAQLPTGTRNWYVKKPTSRLLVISDYQKSDSLDVKAFYRSVFPNVTPGLAKFDELDIRYGSPIGTPGVLVPKLLNPQFVQTLKLYDFVFWYTDQFPSLTTAQFPLYLYTASGGRVIYTTEFASAISDPRGSLVDFAPLDSISSADLGSARVLPSLGDTRLPAEYVLHPDSSVSTNIYPTLSFNSDPPNHLFFLRPVYRRTDARVIYRLQADQRVPVRYTGRPDVGVIDNGKHFVFLGIPLHILNGTANGGKGVTQFLQRVFLQEFGF
jgi:hypothetical protein